MLHADRLFAMRRKGWVPTRVHIDLEFAQRFDDLLPFDPDRPQLYIAPDENVHRIDMRCLVGLEVNVSGCDAARVDAVSQAAERALAKRVIGITHAKTGSPEEPLFPVVRITDTKGVLTWPMS